MNDQVIMLLLLVIVTVLTLFLYVWKAKKEVEYRKDERWLMIQNSANRTANVSNYLLILVIAIGKTVILFADAEITLTLDRALLYGLIFVGLRNVIELVALLHYDKQM